MAQSGEEFRKIYQRRFAGADRQDKAAVWKVLVECFFQRWIGADEVVLDLGCGFGEFLNHLRCRRKIAVDMDPSGAEYLHAGAEFHAGDVCDLGFLPDASVTTVFTSNLMEHLPDKAAVERMLREVHRVLKPAGQLIAMGPNLRCLPGRYWDFWDHLVPITHVALVEILELLGFRIVQCVPRFLPYTTCSRFPRSAWLVRLYLKLRPAWALVGRQFLIRAQKGGG